MSAHQLVFDMVLSKTAAWLLSAAKRKWRSGALHRSILQQHSNATNPKTMCESGSAVLLQTRLLSFFVLTVDFVFHHKIKPILFLFLFFAGMLNHNYNLES